MKNLIMFLVMALFIAMTSCQKDKTDIVSTLDVNLFVAIGTDSAHVTYMGEISKVETTSETMMVSLYSPEGKIMSRSFYYDKDKMPDQSGLLWDDTASELYQMIGNDRRTIASFAGIDVIKLKQFLYQNGVIQ